MRKIHPSIPENSFQSIPHLMNYLDMSLNFRTRTHISRLILELPPETKAGKF